MEAQADGVSMETDEDAGSGNWQIVVSGRVPSTR